MPSDPDERKGLKNAERIETLLAGLKMEGFIVAKDIATILGRTRGEMPYPLCQKTLKFSIAAGNRHMAAKCSTPYCINMME